MSVPVESILYRPPRKIRKKVVELSVYPLGLDSEAYTSGQCFIICTSEGECFTPENFPSCLFTRKYRNKTYVFYNLKYDEGAIIQFLPVPLMKELWENGCITHEGFNYKIISRKCLTITRGKNSVHIYDGANFFKCSLETAASKYLGKHKVDIDTTKFTPSFVNKNMPEIERRCIKDAELVRDLMAELIGRFENFGVYLRKFYSVAYASQQYFMKKCKIIGVERFMDYYPEAVQFSLNSYAGGKFEVTEKGVDDYVEYDISSAYPFEIANLVDISGARVEKSNKYRQGAVYGYLHVKAKIPFEIFNPHPVKLCGVNTFPVGELDYYITKEEYEYLISNNVDVSIINAYWLHVPKKTYPYREEIYRLYDFKNQFKAENNEIDYQAVKVFLNSFYGKFIQLIKFKEGWKAGTLFNPFYASVITANTRLRITSLQQKFPSIKAVHTDSVTSNIKLPLELSHTLGGIEISKEGKGIILGAGIYQIGNKKKFRGFQRGIDLFELCQIHRTKKRLKHHRPLTWREVVFHGWDVSEINHFQDVKKWLKVDFDIKRVWLRDYKYFDEVFDRKVESIPLMYTPLLF